MKSTLYKTTVAAALLVTSVNAMADGPIEHLSQASGHSAQAVAQTSIAGVKVAAGVVAVPLIVVGEMGDVSGQAGEALWDEATSPIGEPLPITDDILTTRLSPEEAMKTEGE